LYATYTALLDDMQNGHIHFAWLPPVTYLYANQRGFADARLISNHFGVYQYGVQFLANANSGYQIYFDPQQGQNVADASTALAQFSGKTPCLLEPDSVSGYLVPLAYLTENNVDWNEPLLLRSYTGIVRAIYITGICDFGVTFAISGDPRTSSSVQQDLTDSIQRVPVIWRSDAVIPNLGLAFLPDVPSNIQANIEFALLDLTLTNEGKQLLSTANDYEIQELKSIDDQYYQRFRELLALTNRDLRDLIGK
jgi:phosphonate transport system substrate-binding protein